MIFLDCLQQVTFSAGVGAAPNLVKNLDPSEWALVTNIRYWAWLYYNTKNRIIYCIAYQPRES